MFCAFHEKRLAHDKCSLCGIPICGDCHRVLNGAVYCPNCLSKSEVFQDKKYFQRNPITALLLSILPGLGQVYNGQLLKGIVIFFTCWLIVPWLFGMYDAYTTACRINSRETESNISLALLTGCLVLIILFFGIFTGGPFFLVKGIPYMIQKVLGGSPEAGVKKTLAEISGAVQSYHTDHGEYPRKATDLYFGDIPYLSDMHCGTVRGDYQYECNFSAQGYEVKVIPLKQGLPSYRMTPGPVVEKFK